MGSYNGLIGSTATTSEVLFGASFGSYKTNVIPEVPHKWFKRGALSVQTKGISGTFGLHVVGAIGGATFVIAGISAVTVVGSTMLQTIDVSNVIWGTSGTTVNPIPRPAYIQWQPSGADGVSFSAAVFIAGDY